MLYLDRSNESEDARAWSAWIDKGIANVRALGATLEEMSGAEAARRWPALPI